MFDSGSAPYLLLLLLGLIAFAPARYVYLYVVQDPSRSDYFHSEEDLVDRSPKRLALNVGFLLLLAGLAVFLFTPFAADFAHSRIFLPLLLVAGSGLIWYELGQSFRSGKVASWPGGRGTVRSDEKPLQYWAAMAWNAFLAGSCIFYALKFWMKGEP